MQSGEWAKGLKGAALTKTAFEDLPVVGPIVLTVGLLTFVFSTILGWSYYGEKAAEYLLGPAVILPYRVPLGGGGDGGLGGLVARGLDVRRHRQRPRWPYRT